MLERAIAVINGKGGTGKTSITANLAGLFAAAGNPVLAVDLDPQGNLGRDLGYIDGGLSDNGQALFNSVMTGVPLEPVRGVRPNLDVVAGGDLVEDMAATLHSRSTRGQGTATAIRDVIAPIADQYSLILVDCPPGNRAIQQMALTAAHYAVIPTRSDEASFDGLLRVAQLFSAVKGDTNPDLALLGVILFGIGSRSRRIAEDTRAAVARDLGSADLVFEAGIRHVEGPARDCRRLGLLVHEIEAKLPDAKAERFKLLRARRGEKGAHRPDDESAAAASTLAASAPGLASDYENVARELTERISAAVAA